MSKLYALFFFIEVLKSSLFQSVKAKYNGQNQGQTQARGHRKTTQKVWQDAEKRYIHQLNPEKRNIVTVRVVETFM